MLLRSRFFAAAPEAFRLWLIVIASAAVLFSGLAVVFGHAPVWCVFLLLIAGAMAGLPALAGLLLLFMLAEKRAENKSGKAKFFLQGYCAIAVMYALPAPIVFYLGDGASLLTLMASLTLPICCTVAYLLQQSAVNGFFTTPFDQAQHHQPSIYHKPPFFMQTPPSTLTKGIVTAILILVMMIPTFFISNIVAERKSRQQDVVAEVSDKWASAQTVSGFFLHIPYEVYTKDASGKAITVQKEMIVLPENASVTTVMEPEVRLRSIYKVLLYKSRNQLAGEFRVQWPKELESAVVHWPEARICVAISDIKGIDEKLTTTVNGQTLELSPGLPTDAFGKSGLSIPLNWTTAPVDQAIRFQSHLALKGSEQLHFLPLAGNSQFAVSSSWNNPSFDGNTLPGTREVSDSGFRAKWNFNKANLPFGTHLPSVGFEPEKFAFGITMVQPADQYAKTERSVKYAILFIGLTFSLFFIIELLQKKAFHPVQYVMVGIALSIFYTLLLSIGEFIPFDYAYLVAATAVVMLISLYAKAHFRSARTAFIFGAVLTCLYVFTFVLVRLEDTALLIGSIGLFCILALAMYFSRKVNWYGTPDTPPLSVVSSEA